jgi:ADP-ribosylglycohydrolase
MCRMPRMLRRTVLVVLVSASVPLVVAGHVSGRAREVRTLSRKVFEDKVRGGWAGQMIGVSFGAPTEFKSNGKIIEGDLPAWTPDRIENAIDQDDLYVEMTFAAVMDGRGLDATTEEYGDAFRTSKYRLWHANAGARRLLDRGVKAPLSGDPKYNVHANDIDFQIESDFIGLMTPGLPADASKYAMRVGRVMSYGDGLYGGVFVASMYAAAFFERDPRRVVEAGLASLPRESGYARIIRDVLRWSAENPRDWRRTWQLIQDTWDRDDPCPDGSLQPFNIDAKLNGAYIVLGLLYGAGGFDRTLDVSTRAGQDSDCNPSSAAGILGVMLGYDRIPARWKGGLPPRATRKFAYTNYSFEDIVASTTARAAKVVAAAGGRFTATEIAVPHQSPAPPALEQWDMGVPDRRISVADPAWHFVGGWTTPPRSMTRSGPAARGASTAGAEATLTFTGSAVTVLGVMSQSGGRADVFLDGTRAGEIDAYIPPDTTDNALWHTYGLPHTKHTVRIVTRADKAQSSKGTVVTLTGAVTYRSR